jgi:integral membrane protein (TIGR01906 family)
LETPTWLATLARGILLLAIPIILLVTPLHLFVTPQFVQHEYGRRGFPPAERFTPEERSRLSAAILHYLRGQLSVDQLAALSTTGGERALQPREVQHLVDVKRVMDAFFTAHIVALGAALLALAVLWRPPHRPYLPSTLQHGVWLTAGVMGAIILAAALDFEAFFTLFHRLFFAEGSWLFYETDTLIQLYPLPFWVDAVWKLGLTILLEAALLYGVAFRLDRSAWLIQEEVP